MNVGKVRQHIRTLIGIFQRHRNNANVQFQPMFERAKTLAEHFGVLLTIPRKCSKMTQRANYDSNTPEEYYRISLYVPYMDSLINSLTARFDEQNEILVSLSSLMPREATQLSREQYAAHMQKIANLYALDNFCTQADAWYEMHVDNQDSMTKAALDLLNETDFYPAIKQAMLIYLALPATTCAIERSFSTLRRVKTWLRSTMTDDRLSGLCMMSVHRREVNEHKQQFMDNVIDTFGSDRRRLQFLFSENK